MNPGTLKKTTRKALADSMTMFRNNWNELNPQNLIRYENSILLQILVKEHEESHGADDDNNDDIQLNVIRVKPLQTIT